MRMSVKLSASSLVGLLLMSPVMAQQPNPVSPRPAAGTVRPEVQKMAGVDSGAISFNLPPAAPPVVNPPDPLNPGTLAETARNTALISYPGSP